MKKLWLLSTLVTLFYLIPQFIYAQNTFSTVSGNLFNSSGAPIAFSTVALFATDSSLIKGVVTDGSGAFTIQSTYAGDCFLKVQNIEFMTYTSPMIALKSREKLVLKPIIMEPSNETLSEVLVSGKKQMIEVLPDKMVFNVSSTINASGNNGLELLKKAPGVIVDPDNNIILQGKSGVRIFINGRPSRLSGADLTTLLESMQSDNIETIELITNPSAKYEAEGNAGIINIKLKNNINLGYNGNIISSYSRGDAPRMSNGATFNYGKDRLSLSLQATRFDNVFQEAFNDYKEQSGYGLRLRSIERQNRNGYNFSSSLTYQLSEKHSVNLSAGNVITHADDDLFSETYIEELSNNQDDQNLISETLTNYKAINNNFNLNYQWIINKKSSFSSDLSYGNFSKDNRIDQPNTYYNVSDGSVIREANAAYDPYTNINLYSAKVDFEYNFEKVKLSTGAKYYQVDTRNEFIVSDVVGGRETVDLEKSNTFNYTEEVSAVYAIMSGELLEDLKLNLGMRFESTASLGLLESTQETANDRVPRDYNNLFPNVSLSYKISTSDFSIGYGQRISRPNYQDLNPFEVNTSELTIWKGNPFLNPNFITNYQFTYSWNDALVISNTFSITEGYFARILEIVDETSTFIVPRNMNRITNNGLSVSFPLKIADWWNLTAFTVYNRSTFEGQFDNTTIDITADIFNARIQNAIELPLDISMSLSAYYNSPWIWRGSINMAEYYGVEVGLKRDFFHKKLQVRLTGSDIFNTSSDYGYAGDYGGLKIKGVYSDDTHRFGFGLTYKFGNQKIEKQARKGGLDDQLDRISD